EAAVVHERHIACRVHATGHRAFDLAASDTLRELDRCREARSTRALHVVCGGMRIESCPLGSLTRQVPVPGVLDDCARSHFAERLALEAELGDERGERRSEHVLVACVDVRRVAAGKRNACAAENGDGANDFSHDVLLRGPSSALQRKRAGYIISAQSASTLAGWLPRPAQSKV